MLIRLRVLKGGIEYYNELTHVKYNEDGGYHWQFEEEMETAFGYVQQGYVLEITRVKGLDFVPKQ